MGHPGATLDLSRSGLQGVELVAGLTVNGYRSVYVGGWRAGVVVSGWTVLVIDLMVNRIKMN